MHDRIAQVAAEIPMQEPARVLLVGNDPVCRHEQIQVLHHFWTLKTADFGNFEDYLMDSDVVVLCHSLTHQEQESAIEKIHTHKPKHLLVKMNGYDSGPHAGMDASVDLHHGPGALVSIIYQLFTERGLPSRGWQYLEDHLVSGVQ